MGIKLRPARPADAPGLVDVKQHLRMQPEAGFTQQGGFLLGTSLEQYRLFIARDEVWVAVAEETGQIVGFSIVLGHEAVVSGDLWQKAAQAHWTDSLLSQMEQRRVAYYEQLAFLPGPAYRVYAKYLALVSVQRALAQHASLFTTVIQWPVQNQAALPFLRAAGFERVGCIDEEYPHYGRVISDIYHLDRTVFAAKTNERFLARFIAQAHQRGYHWSLGD